jgi:hypothetical protein
VAREARDRASSDKQTSSPPAEPESTGPPLHGGIEPIAAEDKQEQAGVQLSSSPAKPKEAADEIETLGIWEMAYLPPDNGYWHVGQLERSFFAMCLCRE